LSSFRPDNVQLLCHIPGLLLVRRNARVRHGPARAKRAEDPSACALAVLHRLAIHSPKPPIPAPALTCRTVCTTQRLCRTNRIVRRARSTHTSSPPFPVAPSSRSPHISPKFASALRLAIQRRSQSRQSGRDPQPGPAGSPSTAPPSVAPQRPLIV
jgi:hypothetical protein